VSGRSGQRVGTPPNILFAIAEDWGLHAGAYGTRWFRAPKWEKHVVDDTLRDTHALATADFDRDGDLDLAVGSFSEGLVLWLENIGGGRFVRHVIDDDHAQQSYDLKIADVDGDGRPDILIAGRQSKNVVWYRQQ